MATDDPTVVLKEIEDAVMQSGRLNERCHNQFVGFRSLYPRLMRLDNVEPITMHDAVLKSEAELNYEERTKLSEYWKYRGQGEDYVETKVALYRQLETIRTMAAGGASPEGKEA